MPQQPEGGRRNWAWPMSLKLGNGGCIQYHSEKIIDKLETEDRQEIVFIVR
jgi:hypothetical protein